MLLSALITNDGILMGLLVMILAFVFITNNSPNPKWKKFYRFVPPILLCYFLPAMLNWPLGLADPHESALYNPVASRFLLPAALILLCVGIDFKGLVRLGPKSLIMFFAATVGIMIGGPIALLIVGGLFPSVLEVGPQNELWEGLATLAGSWIGGGGNMTAMKEIYEVKDLFTVMAVVDVIVANIWMGFLLYGAGISARLDKWLKADASAIEDLKTRLEDYSASIAKNPTTTDYFIVFAVAFGGTAVAHLLADLITPLFTPHKAYLDSIGLSSLASPFFWLIVVATTIGLALSFTNLRKIEGLGASKIATVFIFFLVATIGLEMNILKVTEHPGIFMIGLIWMIIHVSILLGVAKLIKAPFFFVAVGSQANVGGAATAPVVASAFSPSLAAVGAIMAVLGYAMGTYGAIICAMLMNWVSGIIV